MAKKKYRYSVLAYNLNDYEIMHEVKGEQPDDVEFIYVTDNPNLKSDTWTVVYDKDLTRLGTFERVYYVKYNPFKYVNSDIVVRIDSSMGVNCSLDDIVNEFIKSGCEIGLSLHPTRENLLEEWNAWLQFRGMDRNELIKESQLCQNIGYNAQENHGLVQYNISIHKRNKMNDDFNRLTYAFLKYLGTDKDIYRLDQTVASMVLSTFFKETPIFFMAPGVSTSKYLTWYAHNSEQVLTYDNKLDDREFSFRDMPVYPYKF